MTYTYVENVGSFVLNCKLIRCQIEHHFSGGGSNGAIMQSRGFDQSDHTIKVRSPTHLPTGEHYVLCSYYERLT